jgi:hypothetical protein
MAALLSFVFIVYATTLLSAEPNNACALLTQARLSTVVGVSMDAGEPIARPTACQWAGRGKMVTLTITQTKGGKTPVDQFNESKKSKLPGINLEPVSGVGDDAFYVSYAQAKTSTPMGLVVKKGSSSFEIRVYGFSADQARMVSKTLAQDVLPKF